MLDSGPVLATVSQLSNGHLHEQTWNVFISVDIDWMSRAMTDLSLIDIQLQLSSLSDRLTKLLLSMKSHKSDINTCMKDILSNITHHH